MVSEQFTLRCSKAPFCEEELDILRQYGAAFERLSNGERAPATVAQEQFVDAARRKRLPETVYERVWTKYLRRLEWDKTPITTQHAPFWDDVHYAMNKLVADDVSRPNAAAPEPLSVR